MRKILSVTSLVQALSISCLKGVCNTTTPFFPFNLAHGWGSFPPIPIHPHPRGPTASNAATQSLQVAYPMPSSPHHGIQAPEASPYSPSLLSAHTAELPAALPTNHVFSVVWAQAIPGMPFPSFSTLNTSSPFRLIWNVTSSLNLPRNPHEPQETMQTQFQPSSSTDLLVLRLAEFTVIASTRQVCSLAIHGAPGTQQTLACCAINASVSLLVHTHTRTPRRQFRKTGHALRRGIQGKDHKQI